MISEGELAAYLDETLKKRLGRLFTPFFRATITAVSGVAGNYQVQLRFLGDSAPSSATYQVAPTYVGTPTVGDQIEGIWRDRVAGYVLWKAAN